MSWYFLEKTKLTVLELKVLKFIDELMFKRTKPKMTKKISKKPKKPVVCKCKDHSIKSKRKNKKITNLK